MDIKEAYKYCPRCGNKFTSKKTFLECKYCGMNYYLNPKACNGLVLKNERGEIMLVERAVNPKKGYWDVPGGFLDVQETFEESVHREVKEELGIEIGDLKYAGSWVDTYEFQGINHPTVCAMFSAEIKGASKIKPADDVASYKFFKPAELPFEKFAFPWMKEFFKSYI